MKSIKILIIVICLMIASTGCLSGNIVDDKYYLNAVGNLTPVKSLKYFVGSPVYKWAGGYFANLTTDHLNLYNDATQISRDGAGNMIFTDVVSGTQTLADLLAGGGGGANVTGTGTAGRMVRWNGLTVIGDATNTDAQVSATVTASHAQGTDTTLGVQTANISLGNHYINSVADPSVAQDAATKNYVDTQIAGIPAGTGNVTTAGGTANYVPKFTSATNIGNAHIYDNGTYVSIGNTVTTNPDASLEILNGSGTIPQLRLTYTENALFTDFLNNALGYLSIMPVGTRVGINDLTPSTALDVTGAIHNTLTIDSDSDINAGNDLSAGNDLNVTDDADIGGDLRVIGTANATQLISHAIAGTSPLIVVSNTLVSNLNADMVDGQHASAFSGNITGAGTAGYMVQWGNTSVIANATNTNAQVSATVSASHAQGTDTTLGVQTTALNMGTNNITNVGYVDGYDVSALGIASHTQGTDTTLGTMTANISMGNYYINNLGDPSAAQDAATKNYVDTEIAGIPAGSGNVTVTTSTVDYLPRFSSTTNLVNSTISSNATWVYIDSSINLTGNITLAAGKTVDGKDVSGLATSAEAVTAAKADADIADAISKKHSQNTDTALGALSANISANSKWINGLSNPSQAQDAATKGYVDTEIAGIPVGTGNVTTGGGTANAIPKFTSSTNVSNSTLTDNGTWVVTSGYFQAVRLNSTQATGTAPFTVASTTNVTNLNADYLDGYHASNLTTISITFVIDGGGSAITTGIKGDLEIPFACAIDQATTLADTTGNISISVWKDIYANFPPTSVDNITAAAPISIVNSNKSQDTTLSGWTKTITAGDILRFNVDSVATITRVTISLRAIRQ